MMREKTCRIPKLFPEFELLIVNNYHLIMNASEGIFSIRRKRGRMPNMTEIQVSYLWKCMFLHGHVFQRGWWHYAVLNTYKVNFIFGQVFCANKMLLCKRNVDKESRSLRGRNNALKQQCNISGTICMIQSQETVKLSKFLASLYLADTLTSLFLKFESFLLKVVRYKLSCIFDGSSSPINGKLFDPGYNVASM